MPTLKRLPRLIYGVLLLAAAASMQAQLASIPGTQIWTSPDLGLRFAYSTAFDREPVDRLAAIPGALFAAANPDCINPLLTLGSHLDLNAEIQLKGKDPQLQPKGTLAVAELKRTCFAPDVLDDDILREAIAATAKIDGMRPLTRPTNDFVLGSTVWFAAATGFNKDTHGKRAAAAGTTILGTAGALVNGHLIVWSVTSNDPALFNKLLNVSVCFDIACDKGTAKLIPFRLAEPREIASR